MPPGGGGGGGGGGGVAASGDMACLVCFVNQLFINPGIPSHHASFFSTNSATNVDAF